MRKKYIFLFLLIINLLSIIIILNKENYNIKMEVHDILEEKYSNEKTGKKVNYLLNTEAKNKVSTAKAQISKTEDNKCHIRFISGIDSIEYEYASFNIVAKDQDNNVIKEFNDINIRTAYTYLYVDNVLLSASEAFGEEYNYVVAFTINNIPVEAWGYDFYVISSICTYDQQIINSDSITKNINDIIKIEEEKNKKNVYLSCSENVNATFLGEGKYTPGTAVTLQAYSNNDYLFAGWYDTNNNLISHYNEYTFLMPNNDLEYKAIFAKKIDAKKASFSGVIYTLQSTNVYYLTGFNNEINDNPLILEYINGLNITRIVENSFKNCLVITKLNIPVSITKFDKGALSGLSNLTQIILPFIGGDVSSNNTILGYMFGSNKFDGSSKVSQYFNNYKTSFYIPMLLKEVKVLNAKSLDHAFEECKYIEKIELDETITFIGKSTFNNCSGLKYLIYGNNISSIGNSAFYGCTNLIKFNIPTKVTTIEVNTFRECTALNEINIHDNVTKIDDNAFAGCISLKELIIPESVKELGNGILANCTNINNITIPFLGNNTTSYDNYYQILGNLFFGTTKSDNSITTRQYYSIKNGGSYRDINIPKSLINITVLGGSITYGSFYNCECIEEIKILSDISHIDTNAFYECKSLTSIYLPSTIKNIYSNAFYGCKNLTNVYYYGTIESWNNINFENNYSNPMYYASHLFILNENNEWVDVNNLI